MLLAHSMHNMWCSRREKNRTISYKIRIPPHFRAILFPGTRISSTQSTYIPEKKNHNLKVVSLRKPENLAKQTCFLLTEFRKTNINAVASKKQKQTIDAYLTNVEKSASRRQCLARHVRLPDGDPPAQRDRDRDRARSLMSSSSLRAAARKSNFRLWNRVRFLSSLLGICFPSAAAKLGVCER